jgi:hypothetical protein
MAGAWLLNLRLSAGMELVNRHVPIHLRDSAKGAIRTPRVGLRALRPELRQILGHELGRAVQRRAAVHDAPLLPGPLRAGARPLRPLLQVAVLVHAPSADGEHNRLAEALPALAERRLDTPANRVLLVAGRTRRRQRTARVSGARVEVGVGLCLADGGGRGVLGVHEGFCDLGEGEVGVGGQEVLDAAEDALEVGAEAGFLEAVGDARGDGREAAEKVGGALCGLRGRRSRSRRVRAQFRW